MFLGQIPIKEMLSLPISGTVISVDPATGFVQARGDNGKDYNSDNAYITPLFTTIPEYQLKVGDRVLIKSKADSKISVIVTDPYMPRIIPKYPAPPSSKPALPVEPPSPSEPAPTPIGGNLLVYGGIGLGVIILILLLRR